MGQLGRSQTFKTTKGRPGMDAYKLFRKDVYICSYEYSVQHANEEFKPVVAAATSA